MLTLDPRSIILVTVLMAVLVCVILIGLYRSIPQALPGLREGIYCAVASSVGFSLLLMRGTVPDLLSLLGGNTIIFIGIVNLYAALRLSTSRPIHLGRWIATGGFAFSAGLAALMYVGKYQYMLMFITGANASLLFVCANECWSVDKPSYATRFTAAVLTTVVITSATRFLVSALGVEIVKDAFDPTAFQKFYFSMVACGVIATLIGLVLMIYERLRGVLLDSNQLLESQVWDRTRDLVIEVAAKEQLKRGIATAAEEERQRIGRELHDDLGQRLTGISLVAESLARRLDELDCELATDAHELERAASGAISQVRVLAHGLIPVGAEPEDFREALAELARSTTAAGVPCDFVHDDPIDIQNNDAATNLFRIAQEAITNAIRHAQATALTLRLDRVGGKITLTIADNGIGFHQQDLSIECNHPQELGLKGGRGIGIMEFRARVIQYRLQIHSAPGYGCIVKAIEC